MQIYMLTLIVFLFVSQLPPPHLLHPLPPALPSTHSPFNRYSRLIRKPQTVVQYKLPGDQNTGVFFLTPAEEKYGTANKK